MSACISSQGEYGSHVPGEGADAFLCQRCYVFDEDGALAEVAGLRTKVAEAEAALSGVIDDNDRLAGQVVAIRALCDEWEALAARQGDWDDDRRDRADAMGQAADDVRAALVASSPTTPDAPG